MNQIYKNVTVYFVGSTQVYDKYFYEEYTVNTTDYELVGRTPDSSIDIWYSDPYGCILIEKSPSLKEYINERLKSIECKREEWLGKPLSNKRFEALVSLDAKKSELVAILEKLS